MSNLDFVNFHQFLFKIFISAFSNLNLRGVGKLTSPLPTNANILSTTSHFPPPPYYNVSVLPAGGEWGVTGRALALAESGYINFPTPEFEPLNYNIVVIKFNPSKSFQPRLILLGSSAAF